MFQWATEEFRILNDWIGWGDPNNGIWFVGVEAGGGWTCDSESSIQERRTMIRQWGGVNYSQYEDLKARDDDDDGQGVYFPIAVGTAKVASKISESNEDWYKYRKNRLWLNSTGVFNTNMLPIGKRSLGEWPSGYKSLFGCTSEEYAGCLDKVLEYRSQRLKRLKEQCNPQAIVCFGKSHWSDFKKFLSLDSADKQDVVNMSCQLYKSQKIILTRHFSNGMPDKILDYIAQTLKTWGVSLP